jgi:hypothetical protein
MDGVLAAEIHAGVRDDYYALEVRTGKGPIILVQVRGAAGDATAARELRAKVKRVVSPLVEQGLLGVKGFLCVVRAFNCADDLLLECASSPTKGAALCRDAGESLD